MRTRLVALAVAVVVTVAGCASGEPRAASSAGQLRWHPCEFGECATLSVPLDYSAPDGKRTDRHIDLAIARAHRARPDLRIGSLLVNPGGPGAEGRSLADYVASTLPRAITDRFDIVAWDPRGSGASAPVKCGRDLDYLFDGDTAPDTRAELTTLEESARKFVAGCVRRSGELLAHISTRDTVRDMDRLRAALGDRRLNFLGFSYGTYVGAMYASMFPHRVRAFVLDGAVNPQQPAEALAIQQAQGFGASLQEFFDWCRRRTSCAFHHGGEPRAAYEALARAIDARPIGRGTDRFGPTQLDLSVAALLYSGADQYRTLAGGLAALESGSATALRRTADQYVGREAPGHYDGGWAAFIAISCADGPNLTVGEMEALQRRAARDAPDFGAGNVGLGYQCSYWPYPPDRIGPISLPATGAPSILVVGTTGDPATPFAWAESLASQLEQGHLVTVTGSTHTASLNGDPCLDRILTRYLVAGATPSAGIRCGDGGREPTSRPGAGSTAISPTNPGDSARRRRI